VDTEFGRNLKGDLDTGRAPLYVADGVDTALDPGSQLLLRKPLCFSQALNALAESPLEFFRVHGPSFPRLEGTGRRV